MIKFDHVTKKYATNVGLNDASIHIDKGEFVFLVGPSGAGKSTLVKLILREIDADSGAIKIMGDDVTKYSARQIPGLRRNVGIVFQDFRLLPKKTVFENVAFAMEIVHKPRKQIKKQVPQVLNLVGMGGSAGKYPDELSAGEQQRVAIARAIINNPKILIADEPTGNLDPDTAWEIMQLLDQINQRGTTILMVTHAKDIVDRMNKRVVAIENGIIVRDDYGDYGLEETMTKVEMGEDMVEVPIISQQGGFSHRFDGESKHDRKEKVDAEVKKAEARAKLEAEAKAEAMARLEAEARAAARARFEAEQAAEAAAKGNDEEGGPF